MRDVNERLSGWRKLLSQHCPSQLIPDPHYNSYHEKPNLCFRIGVRDWIARAR